MMVTRTMSRCNGILGVVLLLSPLLRLVDASVYVDVPFAERVFDSVPYFNFEDTRWPYVSVGDMLVGPISVLAPTDFDNFFMEYQQSGYAQEESQTSPSDTSSASPAPTSINPIGENQMFTPTPSFLLVEFGASVYSSSVENIRRVAKWLEADFVILMVNRNSSWQDKFSFWWTQQFPGIPSELFDNEGKISTKLGQCAFMGMGPKQGEGKTRPSDQIADRNCEQSNPLNDIYCRNRNDEYDDSI